MKRLTSRAFRGAAAGLMICYVMMCSARADLTSQNAARRQVGHPGQFPVDVFALDESGDSNDAIWVVGRISNWSLEEIGLGVLSVLGFGPVMDATGSSFLSMKPDRNELLDESDADEGVDATSEFVELDEAFDRSGVPRKIGVDSDDLIVDTPEFLETNAKNATIVFLSFLGVTGEGRKLIEELSEGADIGDIATGDTSRNRRGTGSDDTAEVRPGMVVGFHLSQSKTDAMELERKYFLDWPWSDRPGVNLFWWFVGPPTFIGVVVFTLVVASGMIRHAH